MTKRRVHGGTQQSGGRCLYLRTLALLLGVASGCATVQPTIPRLPSAAAAKDVRVAAYCELRPVERHRGAVLKWAGSHGVLDEGGVVLGNGERVLDPRDLKTAFDPESKSGRSLTIGKGEGRQGDLMLGLGTGLGSAVLGVLVGALAAEAADEPVAGLCVAGGFSVLLMSTGVRGRMAHQVSRHNAFEGYDASLRQKLGLLDEDLPSGVCGQSAPQGGQVIAPKEPWSRTLLDVDVDFNLGRFYPGPERAAYFSRLRTGVAFADLDRVWTVGATAFVSNQTVAAFGLEGEWQHQATGLWAQLGASVDLDAHLGAKVALGWSILGGEALLLADQDGGLTSGVFLKIRVPVTFFVMAGR